MFFNLVLVLGIWLMTSSNREAENWLDVNLLAVLGVILRNYSFIEPKMALHR